MKALRVSRVKAVLLHNLSARWVADQHYSPATSPPGIGSGTHFTIVWAGYRAILGRLMKISPPSDFRSWRLKRTFVTFNTYIIFRGTPIASHRRLIGDCSLGNWLLLLKIPNERVKIVWEKWGDFSIKYECLCNDQPFYHIPQSNWCLVRK